jgi:hypothetical protein
VLQNNEVSINVEQTGFLQKFKNRMDLPVQLERSTAIDGETIDGDLTNSVTLHSKVINKRSALIYDPSFNNVQFDFTFISSQVYFANLEFPLLQDLNELQTLAEINEYYFVRKQDEPTNFQNRFILKETGGNVAVTGRLKGNLYEFNADYNRFYTVVIVLNWGFNFTDNTVSLFSVASPIVLANTQGAYAFDITLNESLPLQVGMKVWLRASFVNITRSGAAGGSTSTQYIQVIMDSETNVVFSQDTSSNTSTAKVSLIHEAFAKLMQIYTGNTNSFYSEYFGRTDLGYSANGCLAFKSVTNGLNIRAATDENTAQLYPITTSFKDLFEASDAITPLGWGVEKVNGVERIRVEPLEYFYNQTPILTLDNVANIRKTVALDTMYNEIEIGYAKWNLNNTIANGLDEFLSRRNFYVPISNIKKKLNKLCGYIASGYIIETTRRKQFEINPVSTFETDNDMFFICLKTNKTESETDGDFSGIVNVLFFDSLYNIRISPIRNLARWFKYLNSLLFKKPFPELQFNSGEGNYLMRSRDITSCINLPNLTDENQNLNENYVVNNSRIFAPEKFEFEYPLSFAEFENIKNNAIFALEFSCSNTEYKKGFIEAIEYKPNSPDGGIATFKVLSAPNGN